MNKITLTIAALLLSATAAVAAPKTYQVTGPVVEVNDKAIIVMKGKDKWEIQRDSNVAIPADVKAGSKVTIEYTMTAVTVTAKDKK